MSAYEGSWKQICTGATYSEDLFALYRGDATDQLARLPSESIHTCLTSPPYWGARDYEHPAQIGMEDTLEEYVAAIVRVFDEVKRVLVPDGTAWLNLGDNYLHGVGTVGGYPPKYGYKRNKQLSLTPFRAAIALQERGWWIRNSVVWQKTNAMPASVRDRLSNAWEPIFLLTKNEKYWLDLDPVRIPHTTDESIERRRAERGTAQGKASGQRNLRRWLTSPRHRATIEGMRQIRKRPNAPDPVELAAYLRQAASRKGADIHWVAEQLGQPYERIRHYFRTDRIGSRRPPEETWESLKDLLDLGTEFDDAMAVEIGDNVFRNHPKGRNPGDVVSFALASSGDPHFAIMPPNLADWLLSMSLRPGTICLDPFMGLGTTGRITIARGGRFVGIDIHDQYLRYFGMLAAEAMNESERKVVRLRA
jgi:DNA modification methylase